MFNQFGGVKKFYNMAGGPNEAVQAPVETPKDVSQQAMDAVKALEGQDLSTPEAQAMLAAAPQANIEAHEAKLEARDQMQKAAAALTTNPDVAPDIQADAQKAIEAHNQGIGAAKEKTGNAIASGVFTERLDAVRARDLKSLRAEYEKNPTPELKNKLTAYALANFDGDNSIEARSQNRFNNPIAKAIRAVTAKFGYGEGMKVGDNAISPEVAFANIIEKNPELLKNYAIEK